MKIKNRSLAGAFLSIFSASILTLAVSVVFTPLLVRLLDPAEYGDYAFVLSVLGVLMIFANAGVTRGVKKYVPEQNRPDAWQSEVVGFYTRVSLTLVTCLSVPLVALSFVDFFGVFDSQLSRYLQLLAVILVSKQLYWLALNALRGLGFERYSEPLKVCQRVGFATLALTLATLGYGVTGVLVAYIVSLAGTCLVAFVYLSRVVDLKHVLQSHGTLPRSELLTFNLLTIVLLFLMESLYNSDIILLRLLTDGSQTGYYKAALVVAQLIWIVPKALQTLLLHSSSNQWNAGEYDDIEVMATMATKFTLVSTCLMASGLFVLADDFVPLYFGGDFAAAVTPIVLLLPGVVGFAVARPLSAICQGSGEFRSLIYATAGAAGVNLFMNLVLIPLYGMQGAAIATSVGYSSMAVLSVLASRQIGFEPIGDVYVIRIGVVSLLSTAVMYPLDRVITSPYLSLGIVPIAGTAVYLVLVLRVGVISESELDKITTKLPDGVAARTNDVVSRITGNNA